MGSYPNAFLSVTESQLPELVEQFTALSSEETYRQLLGQFGVRRNHPDFWAFSDALHAQYQRQYPEESGLLDYNRIENR